MTKTPEELTAEWKAGKLEADKEYYIKITDDIVIIDFYTQQYDNSHYPLGLGFDLSSNKFIKKILAPVPTYDEYKAMQAELDEFKRTFTSYVGKPIDYDIACETVNKLLDDKEQLKKELESARWYQTVQNEDIGKLRGLLKECKEKIHQEFICSDYLSIDKFFDLLTRINAALGESEER